MTSAEEDTPWLIVYETDRDRIFTSSEENSYLGSLVYSATRTPGQTYCSPGMDGGNLLTVVTADPHRHEVQVRTRPLSGLGAGSSSWTMLPNVQWRVSKAISLDNVFVVLANGKVQDIEVDSTIVVGAELNHELSSVEIGASVMQGGERVFVKVKDNLVVQYAAHNPARVRLVVAKAVLFPLKRK